jgi:hypothetical protein
MRSTSRFRFDFAIVATAASIVAFAMFASIESACSSSVVTSNLSASPDSSDAVIDVDVDAALATTGCRDGEVLTQVALQKLCCTGTLCHNQGARIGDPCESVSAPFTVLEGSITPAICVSDLCPAGPPDLESYSSKTVLLTTPVSCVGGALVASGASTTHQIEHVCANIEPGCGSDPDSTDASVIAPMQRDPYPTLSICSTGNSPFVPCPSGEEE